MLNPRKKVSDGYLKTSSRFVKSLLHPLAESGERQFDRHTTVGLT